MKTKTGLGVEHRNIQKRALLATFFFTNTSRLLNGSTNKTKTNIEELRKKNNREYD